MSELIITRNGVPCPDQKAALEEFKAACLKYSPAADNPPQPSSMRKLARIIERRLFRDKLVTYKNYQSNAVLHCIEDALTEIWKSEP